MPKPRRIVITPGDPAGIGPDITLAIAALDFDCQLIVIADKNCLAERALQLGLDVQLIEFDPTQQQTHRAGKLPVHHIDLPSSTVAGKNDPQHAPAILKSLTLAANGCLDKTFDAMVTGPVNKRLINDAGIRFSGHTEFLAQLTETEHVVMMLQADSLRVALATTHLPLNQVSAAIGYDSLITTTKIIDSDLRTRFAITSPRIAITGLNPHAGEGGYLGYEEIEIILPAIKSLQDIGLAVEGPFPADTVFTPKILNQYDVVLAMYHDQGLPVLKFAGFGKAVNITLGMPIIRTSVDHGTAYDLAGTGNAESASLQQAILSALEMCA